MAGGDKTHDTKAAPQQYQFAVKPEELSGWEGFKKFLWNGDTSEFLGRTGSSWCKYNFTIILKYESAKRSQSGPNAQPMVSLG